MIYLAVLAGAVLYGLIDWFNDKKAIWNKKYLIATVLNVLAGAVLIWALNVDKANLTLGEFDAAKIVGITAGIYGQKLFKMVVNKTFKKLESKIKNTDIVP